MKENLVENEWYEVYFHVKEVSQEAYEESQQMTLEKSVQKDVFLRFVASYLRQICFWYSWQRWTKVQKETVGANYDADQVPLFLKVSKFTSPAKQKPMVERPLGPSDA